MEDIRIALAQITCPVGQLAENLEKHRHYTRRAAKAGARLICFSEASLTGYPSGDDVPHELAQPLNGDSFTQFRRPELYAELLRPSRAVIE